jgi:cytosine deaminase
MLVLARQRDEAIMIGDDIEVSVVDIRGDKVRIGINAPRSVSVHRKEIYEAIHNENKLAGAIKAEDVAGILPNPSNPALQIAHDDPLRVAIEEAKKSLAHGGIPTGAVLCRDGKIIGRGHNRRVQRRDPVAHAELDCLANAGRQQTYRDTVLYATLMPCLMCAGAVVQFGIPKLIVGDATTCPGSLTATRFLRDNGVEIIDAKDLQCAELISKFAAENRSLWQEDRGEASG